MSDKREDGGPAFPAKDMGKTQCAGLSIRDYFAGQALAGLLASPHEIPWKKKGYGDPGEACAVAAYKMADAMLAERLKGGTDAE